MKLNATLTFPDLAKVFREQVAKDVTAAMKAETRALEKRFEAATLSAGLGQGLARTWNSKTYPQSGDSLGPSGVVWSKAPKAMKAFTEGATITARGGRFLAIPSPEVRALRRGRNQPMPTPAEIEQRLGVKLVLVVKRGKRFLIAPSRDKARKRTGPKRLFVAFFLVPRAVIRKRLDLRTMTIASQNYLRAALAEAINRAQRQASGQR